MARQLTLLAVVGLAACPASPRTDQPPAADAPPAASSPADSAGGAEPSGAAPALEGTEWRLVALGGEPVAPDANRSPPGFRLVAEGRKVQGSAGCNRMMGTYESDTTSLKFGPLASTKMACPAMETETRFLDALRATTRYEIAGSNLTLFGADAPVARLEAAGDSR